MTSGIVMVFTISDKAACDANAMIRGSQRMVGSGGIRFVDHRMYTQDLRRYQPGSACGKRERINSLFKQEATAHERAIEAISTKFLGMPSIR
jgi:hypothetical protein